MTSSTWLRAVLLVAGAGLAACAPDAPLPSSPPEATDTGPAPEPPAWARVAPEQIAAATKHGAPVAFENQVGMRFVLIPAGTFPMGIPSDEDRYPDEEPQHEATIPRPFYLQTTETSVAQFWALAQRESDEEQPWSDPVVVTREEALHFAVRLSYSEPGRTYRLPTEREWEYACRAGTTTLYSFGDSVSTDQVSYLLVMRNPDFRAESPSPLAEVGHFPPNAWGLHEMHGNVAEWTADVCPGEEIPASVMGPLLARGTRWIALRGGDRLSPETHVRSTSRTLIPLELPSPEAGVRLVSPLPPKSP